MQRRGQREAGQGISNCSGYTPSLTSPTCSGVSASGDGRLRGSLPKVNITRLSTTMPSATVAISQLSDPRLAKGRTAANSTASPYTPHSASASTMASGIGQPSVCANQNVKTAPNIIALPCAKLTVPETAKVT